MKNCFNSWLAQVKDTPYGTLFEWVPCGRCEFCRRKKRRQWAARCMAEAKTSDITLFSTLTYSETDNIERYDYVQKFFKKLRKRGYKFRYFGCTEFGDTFGRLHHHILLFFRDSVWSCWPDVANDVKADIQACWTHGHVQTVVANIKTINYCVGYVDKKLLDENRRAHNFMSLRDPIGTDYVKIGLDFLKSKGYDIFDGQKVSIARCFKERYQIKKTVREKYEEQERRYKQIESFEQERGRSYDGYIDELARVDKSLQFRREAQRRAKGCAVSKVLRRAGQLSLLSKNSPSGIEESE